MEAYIQGKKLILDPKKSIGKGGEADIYDIGNGLAAKIFKPPDHPDFLGMPPAQQAAKLRIDEHQSKLPDFPKKLPERVIVPQELITDRSGKIIGYSMTLLQGAYELERFSDKTFRAAGISNQMVCDTFCDLHPTVAKLHPVGVVISDFSNLNVLVKGSAAYLIDADSMGFGSYLSRVFTAKFVDPTLCDPKLTSLMLCKPHNENSDWYAFAVMLMESLLFVDPYGGVYTPKDPKKRIPQAARPLHRITVFHPEVKYPKPATPYTVLPDDLLQFFHETFEKDKRGVFPLALLQRMRWTKCINCGMEHARAICPVCAHAAPSVKQLVTVRGNVMATHVFKTSGNILFATTFSGQLAWLYHENDQFKREDGSVVIDGNLDPQMRFRLRQRGTMLGKGSQVAELETGKGPEMLSVDLFRNKLPVFDANEKNRFWIQSGQLMRDGEYGPEYIGSVLPGQTLFWVGETFGFGFYRAGNLSVAFVFDAEKSGINDSVKLPAIQGQVIDSTCNFSKDYAWFFLAIRESGKTINQCTVIKRDGEVVAMTQTEKGDGSWLGTIRGKCAFGNALFSATDDGIVKVEPVNGTIITTKEFPDTEPFVKADSHLFPGKMGIYVVDRQEIKLLKIT